MSFFTMITWIASVSLDWKIGKYRGTSAMQKKIKIKKITADKESLNARKWTDIVIFHVICSPTSANFIKSCVAARNVGRAASY